MKKRRQVRRRTSVGNTKCTKCGWFGTEEQAAKHKCDRATLCTKSLVRSSPRNELSYRQEKGGVQVAFGRGYQAGYQDRVMGREPVMYACTTRKEVRTNEGESK